MAEHLLDQIMVANRCAAGGDQHIGPARAFGHGAQRIRRIRRYPEIDRFSAAGNDEGTQRETIGTDNLVGGDRVTGHYHLVPGRQQGDTRFATHLEPGNIHAGGQADIARGQAAAG